MENFPNQTTDKERIFLSRDDILILSPSKTADYLNELENRGELESFLQVALQDDSLLAHLSYWEKWYTPEQQKIIDKIVKQKHEEESANWELPLGLEKRFTDEELSIILEQTQAIQPTFGCSKGCKLCGLDAVQGVREKVDYKLLENLYRKFGQTLQKSRPILYYASEPKDYPDYIKAYQLAEQYAGYSPYTTTANFQGKEWQKFLNSHPKGTRLSLWDKRYPEKIKEVIKVEQYEGDNYKKEPGMGVSRRDLGYKPEEHGAYDGIFRLKAGVLISTRGIYNLAGTMPSDKYPQGIVVVPLETLGDDDVKEGQNLTDVLRNHIIEKKLNEDETDYRLLRHMIEKNYKGEVDFPPRIYLIRGKEKRFLVWANLDGQVVLSKEYEPENINDLLFAHLSTDHYYWHKDNINEKQLHKVKSFILRNYLKDLKPTTNDEEIIIWELNIPKSGRHLVGLMKEERPDGHKIILVAKQKSHKKPD